MKTVFLFLVLFQAAVSFFCQPVLDLESDKNRRKICTGSEIKEFEKMVGYVDSTVLSITGRENINSAYHEYLNRCYQMHRDSLMFLIPFEEEEKYRFFERMDSVVFNEFWNINNRVERVFIREPNTGIWKVLKALALT